MAILLLFIAFLLRFSLSRSILRKGSVILDGMGPQILQPGLAAQMIQMDTVIGPIARKKSLFIGNSGGNIHVGAVFGTRHLPDDLIIAGDPSLLLTAVI